MAKQQWKPGTMVYPVPAVMVTVADRDGNSNIITVAWTGTVCTNPPMAYISVRPERYSYGMLLETREFVINLTTENLVFATDYCGVKSGRDVDKWKETGLTMEKASVVGVPIIKESPINIECRVTEVKKLGSHHMFLAEVVAVDVDDSYLNGKQKLELNKSKPMVYSHGEYYGLSNLLGTFGYSVKKDKKTKKTPKGTLTTRQEKRSGVQNKDRRFKPKDEGHELKDEGHEPKDRGHMPNNRGFKPKDRSRTGDSYRYGRRS